MFRYHLRRKKMAKKKKHVQPDETAANTVTSRGRSGPRVVVVRTRASSPLLRATPKLESG